MGTRFPCAAGARYVIGGSAPPDDGHHIFKECHSEERSDVGIRIPLVRVQFVGKHGLPHQCAHWFAMTILGSAVHVGGGTHGCRSTGDNRECGASGGVEPRPYA